MDIELENLVEAFAEKTKHIPASRDKYSFAWYNYVKNHTLYPEYTSLSEMFEDELKVIKVAPSMCPSYNDNCYVVYRERLPWIMKEGEVYL